MTDTPMTPDRLRFVVRQLDPKCFVVDDTTTALSYDMRATRPAAQKDADRRNEASVERAATRAIFALKSPPPDGSAHFQSGWDAGLDAAIEAAQASVKEPVNALMAEVKRLRAALSDAASQVAELESDLGGTSAENAQLRARVAELTAAPVDEAVEMTEAEVELEAMRREHPAPCEEFRQDGECSCPVPHTTP
ncbi:hypothetical protein [Streptomyces sp. SR-10]|uniref:hypothetical protein n=1 Tax=Streptomyces sp. SR-10 TaxID=3416442 RepID=UPI003CF30ECA